MRDTGEDAVARKKRRQHVRVASTHGPLEVVTVDDSRQKLSSFRDETTKTDVDFGNGKTSWQATIRAYHEVKFRHGFSLLLS